MLGNTPQFRLTATPARPSTPIVVPGPNTSITLAVHVCTQAERAHVLNDHSTAHRAHSHACIRTLDDAAAFDFGLAGGF